MNSKVSSLDVLADYLSGPDVAMHSVGLGLPDGDRRLKAAERFFALRAAFGVDGYADAIEDRAAIAKATTP